MGLWYKPREWFKKFRKKDLREVCREKYGDDFVKMYDMETRFISLSSPIISCLLSEKPSPNATSFLLYPISGYTAA